MELLELSSIQWAADLMMGVSSATEDPIFFLGDEFQSSFSSGSYTSYPDFASYDGAEVMKTFSSSSVETSGADVSSPSILSFSNLPPVKPKEEVGFSVTRGSKRSSDSPVTQEAKKVNLGTRPPAQAQDHIIAERKRREKLSQKFIALSAIIPGLKKMDKASVLGDAIKYVKQLQARVITLEDQSTKKTVESTVLVRRSKLFLDEEDENLEKRGLPEIEAKLCDKNVLVRIHCEKRKGVLARILGELEKLHLSVINSSALPFADSALDITVTAQVEDGFSVTVKELVKQLNSAVRQLV